MEMTLYDLIDAYEYADLEDTFKSIYGKKYARNAIGFEEVFESLKEMEDSILSDYMLCISYVHEDDVEWHHVSGQVLGNDQSYGLSFQPWKEWLGMKISQETLLNYSARDIICHSLWEMTFHGYSEDAIKQKAKELSEIIEELDYAEGVSVDAMMDEMSDLENEEESKTYLRNVLKHEIEDSSSEDTMI